MLVMNRKDLAICAIPVVSRGVIRITRSKKKEGFVKNSLQVCESCSIVSKLGRAPICHAVSKRDNPIVLEVQKESLVFVRCYETDALTKTKLGWQHLCLRREVRKMPSARFELATSG